MQIGDRIIECNIANKKSFELSSKMREVDDKTQLSITRGVQ